MKKTKSKAPKRTGLMPGLRKLQPGKSYFLKGGKSNNVSVSIAYLHNTTPMEFSQHKTEKGIKVTRTK